MRRVVRVVTKLVPLMAWMLWLGSHAVWAGELNEVSSKPRYELNLPDLDGQQRTVDEFAGKVLLVNFWTSWCPPCIEEMPSIQRLANELREQPFAVLGVNVAESERRVRNTARRLKLEFPTLLDRDGAVFKRWGGNVYPTTYVLDGKGRVRYIGRGPLEWDRVDIVDMLKILFVDRAVSGAAEDRSRVE